MSILIRRICIFSGIVLYGLFFLVPFLGSVPLFDVDELNYAESAREMLLTGDFINVQINFQNFWEKPPLFIWLQVISMKIFGVTEFAARFPNAVCGVLSLIVLYNAGTRLYDHKFGLYWVIAYAGSVLPFFYFKSGIIDPWFNLFIFLGIIYFIYHFSYKEKERKFLFFSALFFGLAVLTKGPVALLVFLFTFLVFLIFRSFRFKWRASDVVLFLSVLVITGGSWYILQILSGNAAIIWEFIVYQARLFVAVGTPHTGFFMFHFVIILVGVFPASVIALLSFRDHFDGPGLRKDFFLWMMILFWIVLLLFSIVNKKIVHYSSLCYFPLTYFAAITIRKYENSEIRIPRWIKYFLSLLAILYGTAISIIPLVNRRKTELIDRISENNPFAAGNLSADVEWSGFEPYIGIAYILSVFLIIYFINRERKWTLRLLFITTSIFVYITIIIVAPRVEKYTQNAAVEFYRSISDKNAYIATLGYKSYAHLYYGKAGRDTGLVAADSQWMLEGDIDRDAYFVFKLRKKDHYLSVYPQLILLDEKNGYVFAKRIKTK